MSTRPDSPEEEFVEPIFLDGSPGIGTPRTSPRARAANSSAGWGLLLLFGAVAGAYAVYVALHPAPPAPAPAPEVAAREPEAAPDIAPRRVRTSPRPARARPPAAAPASSPDREVARHVEPEKKFVDPIEGFDSGEAFDNPPSPGRYGQRTSGLLERSTPAPRPNQPDPSFRTPR